VSAHDQAAVERLQQLHLADKDVVLVNQFGYRVGFCGLRLHLTQGQLNIGQLQFQLVKVPDQVVMAAHRSLGHTVNLQVLIPAHTQHQQANDQGRCQPADGGQTFAGVI